MSEVQTSNPRVWLGGVELVGVTSVELTTDIPVEWISYDPYGSATHEYSGIMTSSWPGFYSWVTGKAPIEREGLALLARHRRRRHR